MTAFIKKIYKKISDYKLSKKVFFLLILLLPVNWAYHWIQKSSYVNGLLVDYLIPTLFFQDILIGIVIVLWLFENFTKLFSLLKSFFKKRISRGMLLFLLTIFVSTAMLRGDQISIINTARIFLYGTFFFYITVSFDVKKDLKTVVKMLAVNLLFLSLLSFGQYFKQSSVFNNYLFFGEQPYSFSTRDVARENLLGVTKIPAYGTFRHPNVFGGYIVIVLTLLIFSMRTRVRSNSTLLKLSIVLGLLSLLTTLSLFSYAAMVIGVIFIYFNKFKKGIFTSNKYFLLKFRLNKGVSRNSILLFCVAVVLSLGLLLPVFVPGSSLKDRPSFYRRSNLLISSYELIKENFVFGVGFGESTRHIERYMPRSPDIRFVQPVHNIFILLFVEAGIFALVTFVYLFYLSFNKALGLPVLLPVWLLSVVILGSFDHYFITMPQTLVILFLILGILNSLTVKGARVLDKELIV